MSGIRAERSRCAPQCYQVLAKHEKRSRLRTTHCRSTAAAPVWVLRRRECLPQVVRMGSSRNAPDLRQSCEFVWGPSEINLTRLRVLGRRPHLTSSKSSTVEAGERVHTHNAYNRTSCTGTGICN